MCKESYERGLGKKFTPPKNQPVMRQGKTARDKANGSYGNREAAEKLTRGR